jgi:mRNA interferase MazF
VVRRGEVYWVNLDPTVGTEIKKQVRPLVVSPDDMNAALPRVIVAPIAEKRLYILSPELSRHAKLD